MKPLKCRNWSGRDRSLIPPASLTALLYPAVFVLRRRAGPGAESARVFKMPKRIRSWLAQTASCVCVCVAALLIGMTGTCLGQTVYWAGISAAAMTAQTNTQQYSPIFSGGATNPGAIGSTAPASSGLIYYYELLYNTDFTGSQVPAPDAAALLGTWLDTGLTATNHRTATGWLLPVNPNIAAEVPWGPGTTNNIMLVGWSANLGTSWAAVKIKLANWDYYSSSITGEAFFGESVTGYVRPGIGNPSPMVFGTGPTPNGLPINSINMQLYWLPPPATAAPVIVGQPTNQNVRFGTTANISVGAVSAAPMAYQWFLGTNAVLETTNSVLCLTNIQPSQAGSYTVVVTNVYGAATSAPALLTVSAEPIIEDSPTNQQAMAGDTVNFSVVAVGLLPMAYHWFFETNAALEATNSVLCLTNVQPSQAGTYTVVITNAYGAATSAPAMLTVKGKPVIDNPPVSQQAFVGDTVTFSVGVEGKPPFAYQWFGTNAIDWATNANLQLTNVQTSQAGTYSVVVTNVYGAATSGAAMLEVRQPGIVKYCTDADLRMVMARGGKVTFACDGIIILTSTIDITEDVVLDGSGHQITISGGNSVRAFCNATNASFTATHLAIANGAGAGGGGILNLGGTVSLTGVLFSSNRAFIDLSSDPVEPEAGGGAILNRSGVVHADNCSFVRNTANTPLTVFPSYTLARACGGAILNESGELDLQSCTFSNNKAAGGGAVNSSFAVYGDPAFGGAIYNNGTMTLDLCTLTGNAASGGGDPGSPQFAGLMGSDGSGGAIFNQGALTISRTSLCGNSARGGSGGYGWADSYSMNGHAGGRGGAGNGGAIFNAGSLSLTCSLLASNAATGGSGGAGGDGVSYMDIGGSGGPGGNGSSGTGGALWGAGVLSIAPLPSIPLKPAAVGLVGLAPAVSLVHRATAAMAETAATGLMAAFRAVAVLSIALSPGTIVSPVQPVPAVMPLPIMSQARPAQAGLPGVAGKAGPTLCVFPTLREGTTPSRTRNSARWPTTVVQR